MLYISADELVLWANSHQASALLPCLIRRLIWATSPGVRSIDFRCESAVTYPGWDGITYSETGSPFVPQGYTVWELSTSQNIATKAENDYTKRKENTQGINPQAATYIFATPRRWPQKEKWVLNKKSEGFWHDVRVYDADDLATWLEMAPVTTLWLAALLGHSILGVKSLEEFWNEWSNITEPQLSLELLLAGREQIVNDLHKWLLGAPESFLLETDSHEEAMAFLRAAIEKLPPDHKGKEFWLSRALIITELEAWKFYQAFPNPLLLIPLLPSKEGALKATQNGHYIYIPLNRHEAYGKIKQLPRLSRPEAHEALKEMGIPEERAWELAGLARRSLLALRRQLSVDPAIKQPHWARIENDSELINALLPLLAVGTWHDTNEHDQRIVVEISGIPYEKLRNKLLKLARESDPPIRLVGQYWIVTSRDDLWRLLSDYLTKSHLIRIEKAVLEVLGERDPAYNLPPSERYMASMRGMTPKYSVALKDGMARSLALMGALAESEVIELADATNLQDFVDSAVNKLFEYKNIADWEFWASLSTVLPLLAESSPEVFLRSLEKALATDPSILRRLFQDKDGKLLDASSPHVGLLWGLEVLAWAPDYFPHAVLTLGHLVGLDPGGQLSNRPINSLQNIFKPWLPQTSASLEQRISALNLLIKREPEVAWELMLSLLPRVHDTLFPTTKPKYRLWGEKLKNTFAREEYEYFILQIQEQLINMAAHENDVNKWTKLISRLDFMNKKTIQRLINVIENQVPDFTDQERVELTKSLRELLSRHLPYQEEKWTLPNDLLELLMELYDHIQPQDPILRHVWLFDYWPQLLAKKAHDFNWQKRELAHLQGIAAREIYVSLGTEGIFELANIAENAGAVGYALATEVPEIADEEDAILGIALNSEGKLLEFARGFIAARFQKMGWDWIKQKLHNAAKKWRPKQKASFYTFIPLGERLKIYLENESEDVKTDFWHKFSIYGHGNLKAELIEWAASQLLRHDRPYTALEFLGNYVHLQKVSLTPSIIIEVMESALNAEPDTSINLNYAIGELLNYLETIGTSDNTLAKLEWAYLPFLDTPIFGNYGYGRGPKALHKKLLQEPEFFVELLNLAFKSEADNECDENLTLYEELLAKNAFRVLKSCRIIPGLQEDGSVDLTKLKDWVERARTLAKENKRLSIADKIIGEILAYAPVGSDKVWPHEAVREVIEEIASEDLERGLKIGVTNKRGVVHKSLYEGGIKERELARMYRDYATYILAQWPRTSAVLKKIAESYERHAKDEDIMSAIDQDSE